MLPDYEMRLFPFKNSDEVIEWVVEFPALKGCSAVGSSPEEALAESKIAKQLWLDAYFEIHNEYPEISIV